MENHDQTSGPKAFVELFLLCWPILPVILSPNPVCSANKIHSVHNFAWKQWCPWSKLQLVFDPNPPKLRLLPYKIEISPRWPQFNKKWRIVSTPLYAGTHHLMIKRLFCGYKTERLLYSVPFSTYIFYCLSLIFFVCISSSVLRFQSAV